MFRWTSVEWVLPGSSRIGHLLLIYLIHNITNFDFIGQNFFVWAEVKDSALLRVIQVNLCLSCSFSQTHTND